MPHSPADGPPVWCAYCGARDLTDVTLPLWELERDFVVVCDDCRKARKLAVKPRPFLARSSPDS